MIINCEMKQLKVNNYVYERDRYHWYKNEGNKEKNNQVLTHVHSDDGIQLKRLEVIRRL